MPNISTTTAQAIVYVLHSPALNLYKVGVTINLDSRMRAYKTHLPDPEMKFVRIYTDVPSTLERYIQSTLTYLGHQKMNEWFRTELSIIDELVQIWRDYAR